MKKKIKPSTSFALAAVAFAGASALQFSAGQTNAGWGFAGVAALYLLASYRARKKLDKRE